MGVVPPEKRRIAVKGFLALVAAATLFLAAGCAHMGPSAKIQAPPGQVQKTTGYNPASGKVKGK